MSVPAIAHALGPTWELRVQAVPTNILVFNKSDQQKVLAVSPMRFLPASSSSQCAVSTFTYFL